MFELGLGAFFVIAGVVALIVTMMYRTVVSTNDVHIVQSAKKTVSYGKDQPAGNKYYAWPPYLPWVGVNVIRLPTSIFSLKLESYAAYDKDRLPFVVDIMAFFCIDQPNTAAQRVRSFQEVTQQLEGILQGASRSILAKSNIEQILEERAEFGAKFTEEVKPQLPEWGVRNVKNIELMDIRDAKDSDVIHNIMAKKKSAIQKESRVEIAKNLQAAKEAEIAADREVALKDQDAKEQVGKRTADKDKNVGISTQLAQQAVKEQEKATAERTLAVTQVQQVKGAEIQREVQLVQADRDRRTAVIAAEGQAAASVANAKGVAETKVVEAEGQKKQTELVAQGNLAQAKLHAEGVQAEGLAKGAADTAVNTAKVAAELKLAEQIGSNTGYQEYLVSIRRVEASEAVGKAQAAALQAAHIKVIANSGNVTEGVDSVMDLLTSKGGTQLGGMLEGLAQTDLGKAFLARAGVKTEETKPTGSGANGTAKH